MIVYLHQVAVTTILHLGSDSCIKVLIILYSLTLAQLQVINLDQTDRRELVEGKPAK